MSHSNSAADKAATKPSGEAKDSGLLRLVKRPELTSVLGAVVIFVLFMFVAPAFRSVDAFATVLYASSTIGIIALAVGLLMIGDEFDLSSGVAVTTAALAATMLNYNFWLNSWVGVFISLLMALSIGAFNGYMVMRTGIPSFLITLAAFLMLQGINLAVTKLVTGQVATPIISDMEGFNSAKAVFASSVMIFGVSVRVTVFWWLLFVAIASWLLFKTRFGTVGFGGMFAVYTYISFTLTENAGFSQDLIWIALMAYGIGMVLGTYAGGVCADLNLEYTIVGVLITLIFVLSGFYFSSHERGGR